MYRKDKIVYSMIATLLFTTHIDAKEIKKLDNLTVTAQKIEESAKDVPIALSVFDEYSIEDKNIQNLSDIANFTSGFYLFNITDNGTASPTIRGIHSDYRTTSSSVPMYVDGVPTFNSAGYNMILDDIERIEVLKGPQSTLYGKNAQAGVINIITKKPNNQTKGKVALELGEDNKRQLSLSVSGPLVRDKFFAGISGRYYEKDGFIKNTYLNKNANDRKNYVGKLNLRYLASDDLELSLITSKQKRKDGGGDSSKSTYSDLYSVHFDKDEENDSDIFSSGLKIDYNIDNEKSIESITAYKKDDLFILDDFDKTTNPLYKQHAFFTLITKSISQELKYKVKKDNYNYLIGLFADKTDEENKNEFDTAMGSMIFGNQEIDSNSIGAFGHIDYKITDRFSILGGIRYDKDTKKLNNKVTSVNEKKSFSEISPKIALKYYFDKDMMGYMNIAKGYKSGGYYIFAPLGHEYYEKESLYSYELGFKSSFLENKLNFNSSIYYIDLSDKQVVVPISTVANYIKNASSAKSKGIELEASYIFNDSLTLTSSFAYNKATFKDFKYSSLILDNNYQAVGSRSVDNSGKTMPYAPKYTYNLGFEYRVDNGFYANANLNGFGSFYIDDNNVYERKPYSLVNAKIGYESKDYDVYLYGKNIFDKDYNTKEHYSAQYVLLSKPREIGVQLVYRF